MLEFYRGVSNVVRHIKSPMAQQTPEAIGLNLNGSPSAANKFQNLDQSMDSNDSFRLDDLLKDEKACLFWNWETEIYYGGEIIKANVTGTDTVKVSIYE